jgi:hypothetical protein
MKTKWSLPLWATFMAEEGGGGADPTPDPTPDPTSDPEPSGEPSGEGYWPADWRDQITGGDETLAKRAARYATPKDAFSALVAAQNRIRSGELKSALPDNPTEEELTAWREENGIPKSPDEYDMTFESGLVIGDEDKPVVEDFLKVAHESNLPPDKVKKVVEWWYNTQQAQLDQIAERDLEHRQTAVDELNVEWGAEYRRNINMLNGVIDQFPESVRDSLKSARLPDGTAILNNPDIIRGFVNLALEINPAGTVVPSGGDPGKSIADEKATIEKTMRENRAAYNKDEKMQARYRELLDAEVKLQRRAS